MDLANLSCHIKEIRRTILSVILSTVLLNCHSNSPYVLLLSPFKDLKVKLMKSNIDNLSKSQLVVKQQFESKIKGFNHNSKMQNQIRATLLCERKHIKLKPNS